MPLCVGGEPGRCRAEPVIGADRVLGGTSGIHPFGPTALGGLRGLMGRNTLGAA